MHTLIQNIKSIITVSSQEEELIRSLFTEISFKKGDFLLKEGDICRYVGFLSQGIVRYFINHDGEEKTYSFDQENNFVCNYESFVTQMPSTKNIQALEDGSMWQISHHDLQLFYVRIGQGERFGRIVIEYVFIKLLKELASFYTDAPELRYERFLKEHPDLQQRISQYHIASFVGVKPQSLSRIRKRIFMEK